MRLNSLFLLHALFLFINFTYSANLLVKIALGNKNRGAVAYGKKFVTQLIESKSNLHNIKFAISVDRNDAYFLPHELQKYPEITQYFDPLQSETVFCNAHVADYRNWFDVLVILDDDVRACVQNWDAILLNNIQSLFPDYDGVLYLNNIAKNHNSNINIVLGKNFFKRFEYVLFPQYRLSWGDAELAISAKLLQKLFYSDIKIFESRPVFRNKGMQLKGTFNQDQRLFFKRLVHNFDLPQELLSPTALASSLDILSSKSTDVIWSILVPSLKERADVFAVLYEKIYRQIESLGLQSKVEILFFMDRGNHKVGFKRNTLLEQSHGEYISYVDDDDDLHTNYVGLIYEKLLSKPDCVSLIGEMTMDGKFVKRFVHTIKCNRYYDEGGIAYRPPAHLNPIKKSLVRHIKFPIINCGEDIDWCMLIAKAGVLKTEAEINVPYYFYRFSPEGTRTQQDLFKPKNK